MKVTKSRLEGVVEVSGAKNSALRLLAASLLTSEKITLTNYPSKLLDAEIHVEMLQALGKKCTLTNENEIIITEDNQIKDSLIWNERSIRNTLLILGALTAKTGKGKVPLPGGCKLGERKYDLHVMILENMGAKVWEEDDYLCAEVNGRLKGSNIFLPIRSTGATENAILMGSLAIGKTTIWNPHIRPEIIDLIDMLSKMGAKITVFGQERIEITGIEALNGTSHTVISDNMEAITWLAASVMTGGDIEIVNFPHQDLEVVIAHLKAAGAKIYFGENSLIVRGGSCYPIEISTGPHPGINSDVQPILAAWASKAQGESKIIDLRFPGRYGYAHEMAKMGVKTEVHGDILVIHGNGGSLNGATVKALDLRAGAALALCGLVAEGETTIEDHWQIMRGYVDFDKKLAALGANIKM